MRHHKNNYTSNGISRMTHLENESHADKYQTKKWLNQTCYCTNRVWTKNFPKQQKLVTSQPLSEYDVISNFSLVATTKMQFFHNFLLRNKFSSNSIQRLEFVRWLPILTQKLVFGSIWDNLTQKPLFYVTFGQTPLKNSVKNPPPPTKIGLKIRSLQH